MSVLSWSAAQFHGFLKDEQGSFTTLGVIVLALSVLAGGIAIDVSRYETYRTELQYNLDRAVLAAASLRQTKDPDVIVEDYMGLLGVNPDSISVPNPIVTVSRRRVRAVIDEDFKTMFLRMAGITTLNIVAESTAEEAIPNLEISLALDVSGSMNGSRMTALRPAAKSFISQILEGNVPADPSAATEAETHRAYFNMIPYAGDVVAGRPLFEAMVSNQDHTDSYCVDLNDSSVDYTTTVMDHIAEGGSSSWGQVPNYAIWGSSNDITDPWCETDVSRIVAVGSKDETALRAQIDDLEPYGNTSIDIAMKWAVGLLDPSMQPLFEALGEQTGDEDGYVATQDVSEGFIGSPVAYDESDTLKVVVLMTDGQNTSYYGLKSQYATDSPSNHWYSSASDKWSSYDSYYNDYYIYPGGYYSYSRQGTNPSRLTWREFWRKNTIYQATDYVNPQVGFYSYLDSTSGSTKNSRMADICDAARDAGIVVFTIGFEAPSVGQSTMQSCATTTSHYYDASVADLETVFGKIAANIHKLRLVD